MDCCWWLEITFLRIGEHERPVVCAVAIAMYVNTFMLSVGPLLFMADFIPCRCALVLRVGCSAAWAVSRGW